MKRIITIIAAALLVGVGATAQTRGIYGTYTPYSVVSPTLYNANLVARTADTLKGVDTAYLYFSLANSYSMLITLQTANKAGALTGTAVLQGWAGSNAGWVTRTGYWESLGGDSSRCSTCVKASKSYSAATGTNRATWYLGETPFNNYRVRITSTNTADTNFVSGFATLSY